MQQARAPGLLSPVCCLTRINQPQSGSPWPVGSALVAGTPGLRTWVPAAACHLLQGLQIAAQAALTSCRAERVLGSSSCGGTAIVLQLV